jgi:hypothetical protein
MLKTGMSCYATKEAIEQGILPPGKKLNFVRRNSRRPEMVRVSFDFKSREVHESFVSEEPYIGETNIRKNNIRVLPLLRKHEYRESRDTLSADCSCGEWVALDEQGPKWRQWCVHFMNKLNP